MTRQRTLEVAAVVTMATALFFGLQAEAGNEQTQGELVRILYVHVPSAWLAYLSFGVTLLGSGMYLWKRNLDWDRLAASSAEVGVFFTGLTISQGMIWGKSTWSVWWTWDARLVLTAVMFFVYLGYLALRRSIPDRTARAGRSAWLGILSVTMIPLVHFSVVWWETLHQAPSILRPGRPQMDSPYLGALFASLIAFTFVYVLLLQRRMELARLEDAFDDALATEDREVAGAAVTAPRYGDNGNSEETADV